jgi:molecular chaperone DnaK (HSP70)
VTAIGIDFGTTNSVVAVHGPDGPSVIEVDKAPIEWAPYGFDSVFPSVMARSVTNELSFGWDAKMATSGRFDAVKRLFATQTDVAVDELGEAIAVEEVATMLFAELKRRAVAAGGLSNVDSAVITVPANSRGRARHRTKLCAGMAGLEVLALINEPTAAAMAYSLRHPEARQLLVFDWGGGTLDVTVLQSFDGVFIERASSGLPRSGGIDFDNRLERLVRQAVPDLEKLTPPERQLLKLEIELAKIRLSTSEEWTLQIPGGRQHRVTRSQFEKEFQPLLDDARGPVERCIGELGITPGSIDALVLVGGTCRIPAVRRFVRDLVGVEPDPTINPMTAVGEGAAVSAAILSGLTDEVDLFVALEHSLGTFIFDTDLMEQRFSTIIPRGHKLPALASSDYVPIVRDTEGLTIEVVEGDPEARDPDFTPLKEWYVRLPSEYDEDSTRAVNLEYRYDVDGILQVTVRDNDTGVVLLSDDVSYGVAEDKRQLKRISDRAQRAVSEGRLSAEATTDHVVDPESAKLISQARAKVIPFLDEEEAAGIVEAVATLESATGSEVESARQALALALRPFSYLF